MKINYIQARIKEFVDDSVMAMNSLPEKVFFGYEELEFYKDTDALLSGQFGYAINENMEYLSSWNTSWLVIGRDNQTGDPIFVDLNVANFPVYFAVHGQGAWSPEMITSSLSAFTLCLGVIQDVAQHRSTPALLEANPLDDSQKNDILGRIKMIDAVTALDYWEGFLNGK